MHVCRAVVLVFAAGAMTMWAAEDRPPEPLCAYRVDDFNRARAKGLIGRLPSELVEWQGILPSERKYVG